MRLLFKWILISSSLILLGLFLFERCSRIYLAKKYAPPGQLVDIGNRQLHLHCQGTGRVTVVLEDGLGPAGSLAWVKVQPSVAAFTRVCTYDRAGIMWSDPSPHSSTPTQVAKDLHMALEQADIQSPYILVGASMGGVYSRTFAEYYPDEVVGVVLVDSAHPDQEERFPPSPVNLEPPPVSLWLTRQCAAMGILRLSHHLPNRNVKRIPSQILNQLKAFAPQSIRAVQSESQSFGSSLEWAQSLQSLGDRPLIVLTAAKARSVDQLPSGFTEEYLFQQGVVWQELQAELATLSSESQQIISEESSHLMYFDQPDLIVDAVRKVLNQVMLSNP